MVKIPKGIQINVVMAIILMVYFLLLNVVKESGYIADIFQITKIFSIIFMIIGLVLIERAYKKDDSSITIMAIEFLIIAAHSLSAEYVVQRYDVLFEQYILISSYVFAIYYVLKSIFVYTRARKKEMESYSDIPELVKKEKPVVKTATKKNAKKSEDETSEEKNDKNDKNLVTEQAENNKAEDNKKDNKKGKNDSKVQKDIKNKDNSKNKNNRNDSNEKIMRITKIVKI